MENKDTQGLPNANERAIRLVEATNLAEGQNFFDQAPFNFVIEAASKETQTDQEKLRWMLKNLVNSNARHIGKKEAWQDFAKISTYTEKWASRVISLNMDQFAHKFTDEVKDKLPAYNRAAIGMLVGLQDCPFWAEYIDSQQDQAFYKFNGSFREDVKMKKILPETYTCWASNKIKRQAGLDANSKLLGIGEAFLGSPGSVAGTKSRSARRWNALKASEIVRQK